MKLKVNINFNVISVIALVILIIFTAITLIYNYNSKKEFIMNKKIEDWKHELIVLQNYTDVKKIYNEVNDIDQFDGISDMKSEIRFVADVAYKLNIKSGDVSNNVDQNFIDSCGITSKGEIIYAKGITFDKYTIYYSPGYIFKVIELSGLINEEDEKNITNGNLEY